MLSPVVIPCAFRTSQRMKSKPSDNPRHPAAKATKAKASPKTSAVGGAIKAAKAGFASLAAKAGAAAQAAKPKSKSKAADGNGNGASRMKIPPILLEGDAPAAPGASGPGQRYALGPTPSAPLPPAPAAELPESYGTQQLYLTARDPRWLYAHWDFTREQIRKFNGLSSTGRLALRVFKGSFASEPIEEIQVHPESRNWFIPVPSGATKYLTELGYHDSSKRWVSLSRSEGTFTPPDTLSDDTAVRFATIPYEIPFAQLLSSVKSALSQHVPLVEALQQLRAQGHKGLPENVGPKWTAAQDKALGEVVSLDKTQRIWIGSLEITELIRRQWQKEMSSMVSSQFGVPSSWSGAWSGSSAFSPFGAAGRKRGFWFMVNAELIIYGATEPDATVTIGDRKIKLRPDGSFSFRFALPDGDYVLPAAAHSADGEETRAAELRFHRGTHYTGDVGQHPQDKNLRPPVVAAVA